MACARFTNRGEGVATGTSAPPLTYLSPLTPLPFRGEGIVIKGDSFQEKCPGKTIQNEWESGHRPQSARTRPQSARIDQLKAEAHVVRDVPAPGAMMTIAEKLIETRGLGKIHPKIHPWGEGARSMI